MTRVLSEWDSVWAVHSVLHQLLSLYSVLRDTVLLSYLIVKHVVCYVVNVTSHCTLHHAINITLTDQCIKGEKLRWNQKNWRYLKSKKFWYLKKNWKYASFCYWTATYFDNSKTLVAWGAPFTRSHEWKWNHIPWVLSTYTSVTWST